MSPACTSSSFAIFSVKTTSFSSREYLLSSLVYEIVNAIVKAIEKPVTVKIRKGFDDAHVNAVEVARAAEEAGASAVAVHGRESSIIAERRTGTLSGR